MKRLIAMITILGLLLCGCRILPSPESTTPPTAEPTSPPTEPPTEPSTEPSTEPPTEPSTEPPTEPPTDPPTEPPTEPPTDPPTEPPTEPPSAAEVLWAEMTLEEKVGQLFLARCPDMDAAEDAAAYHLGGYILFGRDFDEKSYEEVCQDITSYQQASKIPMLIAVDEEGGIVCRVSSEPQFRDSRFPSPRRLYEAGGLELILSTETEKITLLQSLGINVNVAPVCDVTTDPNAFMYSRSLGENPEITGKFIASVVELMNENRFGGVLKHFPGYGNNTDTHVGIAIDSRPLEELEAVDLVPFAAGIRAGAGAIMVSHTFVNCLDDELPASLSPLVIGYLREEMEFDGVVVTDDLVMEAITDLYGAGESAVLAVLAGNDLLCSSEYQIQYQAVLDAVQQGRIPMELLDRAVLRVLCWKDRLGLLAD